MKNRKMILVIGAVLLLIGASTITALAAPGFGAQCQLAGEYESAEEFQEAMLARKQAILDERVAAGTMTQSEADEIMTAMQENMASCDGSGSGRIGAGMGAGFGARQGRQNRSAGCCGGQALQQTL